ncbi:hypothetical protein ACVNS2_27470 [Paenibacillus caseinilyticus]|uniref:Uncharacterized protein n=1 Tax=Paenibacillus mucilaginosus K02 TaxID=997761 RepID=I0BPY3_9BACL|nr:hypothetical protein [Paenibacillus mucilaginosus]AFH64430.1 hypothetical protein B2K_27680 [Paenibacillus mucilaginosus K02]
MKIMITVEEAMQRGIWPQLLKMFGRDPEEDFWPKEEFILTEDQAAELNLIPRA